jgi:hypothetical protein
MLHVLHEQRVSGAPSTCGALKEADATLLQQAIQGLHEVLLDGVGLVGESREVVPLHQINTNDCGDAVEIETSQRAYSRC